MARGPRNRLVPRSFAHVAAGYLLAPLAGLTALWAFLIAPHEPLPLALTLWWITVLIGGTACLLVELLVVTPLLWAYRRHRWRWLTGWTAIGGAFAVGAIASLAWAVLEVCLTNPGYTSKGPQGVAYVVGGVRTAAGWRLWREQLAPSAVACGMVGAISAMVFRLVAMGAGPPEA